MLERIDRRQALKVRHRTAILDAARQLIDERNGPHFSVDELADRADVARRTVFNHFGSSSGVVLTLAEELISDRIRTLRTADVVADDDGSPRAQIFTTVSETLRAGDLAPAIAMIDRILTGVDDARMHQLVEETFTRVAAGLCDDLLRIVPAADPFDAELLVATLMGAINVSARRWLALPGERSGTTARAEWDELLDRCIESIRIGYTT